jgi:hypothetical protein
MPFAHGFISITDALRAEVQAEDVVMTRPVRPKWIPIFTGAVWLIMRI